MGVPRFCVRAKPRPMGSENRAVACGVPGEMWAIEIAEGRDRTPWLGNTKHREHGNAGSLLLWLSQAIFRAGKVVILD